MPRPWPRFLAKTHSHEFGARTAPSLTARDGPAPTSKQVPGQQPPRQALSLAEGGLLTTALNLTNKQEEDDEEDSPLDP